MNEPVRFRLGAFDRWYIVHPIDDYQAWSGNSWVLADSKGVAIEGHAINNFPSRELAVEYAATVPALKLSLRDWMSLPADPEKKE